MEDVDIPSISSGPVGSRFVSQTELDQAKANREAQWKATYARLGQEPPPVQEDTEYDGKSLYERLQTNKQIKQDEWEAKNKLSNQFRALEEDEVVFLDTILQEQRAEERARQDKDSEEVRNFKEAVAARENAQIGPPPAILPASQAVPPSSSSNLATKKEPPLKSKPSVGKKDQKTLLKGVIKKKTTNTKSPEKILRTPSDVHLRTGEKRMERILNDASSEAPDDGPDAKRLKKGDT